MFTVSLLFYSWGEPKYVWIMIFSTVVDYTLGRLIGMAFRNQKQALAKVFLLTSIVINLGILFFFKYAGFLFANINQALGAGLPVIQIALPIGISFYTFQTMSYTIDVYRGRVPSQKNIIAFGTYVALFPQLIAGPIVQYKVIEEELTKRKQSLSVFQDGVIRFITGLGKKVLIANSIGALNEEIMDLSFTELPIATAWLGVLAFMFQIYFDFSGYSDMAIGLGKMFGFHFPENFEHPYMSKSITQFWRRWHITLGSWFREYVYIPLGGNRCSTKRHIFNLSVVWLLTGIWHGASWNFLLWGIYYGVIIILEKLFLLRWIEKWPTWIAHIYSLFLILFGWMIFSIDDIGQLGMYMGIMFGNGNAGLWNNTTIYYLYTNAIILILCVVGSTNYPSRIAKYLTKNESIKVISESIYVVVILFLSVAFLVDASYNPFLYFRF